MTCNSVIEDEMETTCTWYFKKNYF